MWTGRQTLASIEGAIANLRREETQLDAALRSAGDEAERLRKERGEALRELARVKLDEMAAGRLVSNLDAGERRAVQILDDYRLRLAAFPSSGRCCSRRWRAPRRTATLPPRPLKALAAVEAVRATVTAGMQAVPDWQAAKRPRATRKRWPARRRRRPPARRPSWAPNGSPTTTTHCSSISGSAGSAPPLRAGNFVRVLDRMVADFIGFGDVRPNYAALIEIPLRLREHATAKRADADERGGAVGHRAPRHGRGRHRSPGAGAQRGPPQARRRRPDPRGQERPAAQARGRAQGPGRRRHQPGLHGGARNDRVGRQQGRRGRSLSGGAADADRADDAIVRKLEAIDSGIAKADAEIAELRRTAQDLARRRDEVQQVRDRFRGAGYDHPYATFGNDNAIADTLKGVLAGAVNSGLLWDLLRGGYSYRGPRGGRDAGMPGMPFPFPIPGGGGRGSSGGGWREPSSRGDWSPEAPSGGSSGDDDHFTTGGSF